MAEHMLIAGIENPQGQKRYIAAAFPSACGKTNLAMLIPPASMKGWKVTTVGDDIAWLRIGKDGRLWAVNPENGFFGVAPGTNSKTNPNAVKTVSHDSFYTNVALKDDGTVWWEGHDDPPPAHALDWKGNGWTPACKEPAAHPNSRFTAPAANCPVIDPAWQDPQGVPIEAIIFGGRRPRMVPLVYESFNWQHGVFVGSTMASERTAAQYGKQGEVRRDPMAMLPFCGYNMAEYFRHWLDMGKRMKHAPRIFNVNWFRTDDNGEFLWPGYRENLRVIEWILDRCNDKVGADTTPIGYTPKARDIDMTGLQLSPAAMEKLLAVDPKEWTVEIEGVREFYKMFKKDLPEELWDELAALETRLCAKGEGESDG